MTAALAVPSAAGANPDDTVTAAETVAALADTGVAMAAPAPAASDVDSAAQNVSVDVPRNPDDGVDVKLDNGTKVTIDLPNGTDGAGKLIGPSTVAYAGTDGTSDVVRVTSGGPQMFKVIANADAPEQFVYPSTLGVPTILEDGSVLYTDASGKPVQALPAPYGSAADNTALTGVHYSVVGGELALNVPHHGSGLAYPLAVDPLWLVVTPAAVVAATQAALWSCGLGWLAGSAWQVVWNGYVWREVVKAGAQGCVEGVIGRFVPWSLAKKLIKR
ncbi:hypothetical protein [Actinoplanes sp. NPDC026670]|uniref:hypothetical protein n=1 Tax=Actinoplanes sp. NPDC026670 TaxID=3154700 RepID=UPI0034112EEC